MINLDFLNIMNIDPRKRSKNETILRRETIYVSANKSSSISRIISVRKEYQKQFNHVQIICIKYDYVEL